jgi:hypothetical protein
MKLTVIKQASAYRVMELEGKVIKRRYKYDTVLEIGEERFPILLEKKKDRGFIMDKESGYSCGSWEYCCIPEMKIGAVYDLSFHDVVKKLEENLHRLPELRKKAKEATK